MKKEFLTRLSLPMSLSIAFSKVHAQFLKNIKFFSILFLFLLNFTPVFAQKQTVKVNLTDSSVIMLKDITLMYKDEDLKTTYYYKLNSVDLLVYAVRELGDGKQSLLYIRMMIPDIKGTPELIDISKDKPKYLVAIVSKENDKFFFVDIMSPTLMVGGEGSFNHFYFNDKALGEQFVATLRKKIEIYKK